MNKQIININIHNDNWPGRQISIKSNGFTRTIKGEFVLSFDDLEAAHLSGKCPYLDIIDHVLLREKVYICLTIEEIPIRRAAKSWYANKIIEKLQLLRDN